MKYKWNLDIDSNLHDLVTDIFLFFTKHAKIGRTM